MVASLMHFVCCFTSFFLISWPPISANQHTGGQTNRLLLLGCVGLSLIALAAQAALLFRPASRRLIMLNTCATLLIFLLEMSTFVRLNVFLQDSIQITRGLAEAAAGYKSNKQQNWVGDRETIKKCCWGWKLFQDSNLTALFPQHWLPVQCCKLLHVQAFDCEGVKPQGTTEFKSYACVQEHLKRAAIWLRAPNTLLLLPLISGLPVFRLFAEELVVRYRSSQLRRLTEGY
ncbi:unnamed protein product [Schistocephalus solidus]|uniref:Leukocyte surface antigen CD53-like n=1 Tax=Schistocephalus solidus TaxID=70667 RepID=A0A183THH8_SCHSO|nr:unnamed protein product [Schistocephalus solidus]